ncbi:MAG: hypothetical protein HFH94_06610 [Lachnospiraceae bacterium]|jgi:hypothetical protein|nr:hypothetical protein [uncultured Acetatifactor sp.]MCI9219395.1 hypothetical protein [Lachnospiraceae bacterium]
MMGKYGKLMAVICLCTLLLAGCGVAKVPDTVDKPSVAVNKEGEVTVWQVGLFDKAEYVLSELQAMATEEAGRFNSSVGKSAAVAVENVEALEDGSGKVVVAYRFDGWESASDFLEENLFFGGAADAALKGRTAGMAVKSVKDGSELSEDMLRTAEGSVLITDMKGNIYCPGKVTHISEGLTVNPDGSIDTSAAEGTVCILYQ